MPDYYLTKNVEAIRKQVDIICGLLGIDPTPLPDDETINNETIEELTDPDA